MNLPYLVRRKEIYFKPNAVGSTGDISVPLLEVPVWCKSNAAAPVPADVLPRQFLKAGIEFDAIRMQLGNRIPTDEICTEAGRVPSGT